LDAKTAKIRENKYAQERKGCFLFFFPYDNKSWCIDATDEKSLYKGRLINHSKSLANLKIKVKKLKKTVQVYLF
jgi:histone-lysine N-methyltransferase SETD8